MITEPAISGYRRLHSVPTNMKLFGLQRLFEGFIPIYALQGILLTRVGQLSVGQVGQLFGIWAIAALIATIPSGVLADYWSRRKTMIIGNGLRAIGFGVWLVWPTYAGYAIGFALWGIEIAFADGADAAYLHSELESKGKLASFAKYMGWTSALFWVGILSGYLVSAVLTLQNHKTLILLSSLSSLMSLLLLTIMAEHPYKKQLTYIKTLQAGLQKAWSSKLLLYICLVTSVIYIILGVVEEYLPRVYSHVGLSDTSISLVVALTVLMSITLLTRLEKLVRTKLHIQVLVLVVGCILLLLGLVSYSKAGITLFVLFNLMFHLFRTVFYHHIQHVTDGDERATIGSLPSLMGGLIGAIGYWFIGFVGHRSSERYALGVFATFWLVILVILTVVGKTLKIKKNPS